MVDWTIRLIVVNSKLSGASSFQTTVEHCFGKSGLIAISVAQWALYDSLSVRLIGSLPDDCVVLLEEWWRFVSSLGTRYVSHFLPSARHRRSSLIDHIAHVMIYLFPKLQSMPFLWLLTDRRAIIVMFVLGISYPLSLYRDIAKVCCFQCHKMFWL